MIRRTPCVIVATHATGHDDGCEPILNHLARKYRPVLISGHAYITDAARRIARDERNGKRETFIAEAPHPFTAGGVCALAGIPPQAVTHSLLLIDVNLIQFDRFGTALGHILMVNGVTAFALGNVDTFDPASAGVASMDAIGDKAASVIAYLEQYLSRPVAFLATGNGIVIDREPYPVHEQPDKTTIERFGTPDFEDVRARNGR